MVGRRAAGSQRAAAMSSLDQKREAGKARHRKPVDNAPVEEHHETISASYEAHMKLISPLNLGVKQANSAI